MSQVLVVKSVGFHFKSCTFGLLTSWHVHVQPSLNRGHTRVSRAPIRHDVALETEFGLEQTVLGCGVLAAVRTVDALVRAHEGGCLCLHGVGEWPHVELVHCTIVDVGRESTSRLYVRVVSAVLRIPLDLLFIADPVLGASLHTRILMPIDGLLHCDYRT
jgi:hypothetical protein